jgi:tetratricopeptide (TPR) repeat protein
MRVQLLPWLAAGLLALGVSNVFAAVRVSEQDIVIPTYLSGEPEPNPKFYLGQGSQGAQGRVYPYPLYDTLTNIKSNKTYRIVYLENEFVRLGVLPEIGGRLFEGVDKSNGYDFIYRQHVIKPALIGLIGAWISGGVEWNIPHHHRATTALPVQYQVVDNSDGSKTVWVGELELRHRMRWAVGYTLRPGRSYLECSLRILNRTPVVNTMLCFANVAVHVNDQYQVIYPPQTRFVTFHSKHEFTTWPIATTRYAGADFTRGVDVSWYKNHVEANSMFAWNYEDDFFAGYDHGKQAGTMSFADHHIVPGKKFWTWGTGPRGRMWDKILTDEDGPYIELMVGAYSDNQPDYSWLQPYETKSFEMYWYPFRDIGGVKNANLDAAVNLEVTNGTAKVGFCTTAVHPAATVRLTAGTLTLLQEKAAINPTKPFVKTVSLPAGVEATALRASLLVRGKELVAYAPTQLPPAAAPSPVKDPPSTKEIKTVEELYLAGQRIEQFHSPKADPEPYWQEALVRDPGNARVNTALGIRRFKQARFDEAAQHFRTAIERLTFNYTAPKDGEPLYYLGVTLKALAQPEPSYQALYKATWSQAWRAPAYYELAELAAQRGDTAMALDHLESSLQANALNGRALNLKAALLRRTGRSKESTAAAHAASKIDPLDVRWMAERWLSGDDRTRNALVEAITKHPATGLETAMEFAQAGLWQDGIELLKLMTASYPSNSTPPALAYYYLADFYTRLTDARQASHFRDLAKKASPAYGFPFQHEAAAVLRRAMEADPTDARAPYYLGNLLYDWQPDRALELWQKAASLDPSFAVVHRNLGVASAHRTPEPDLAQAVVHYEKAVACPQKYALHFAELDELYAASGMAPDQRLALLEQNHEVVTRRDDALSREIGMKVFAGKLDEAIRLMTGRKFSVWEGGSLEVTDHWVDAYLLRGRSALQKGQFAAALTDFEAARMLPENLPTEQEVGRDAEVFYWMGVAAEGLGDAAKAKEAWDKATGATGPEKRRRENRGMNARRAQDFYAAQALAKLGRKEEANALCRKLIEDATQAQSQPAARAGGNRQKGEERQRAALPHYLVGLGHLGLGETAEAKLAFQKVLEVAPDFLGAQTELRVR